MDVLEKAYRRKSVEALFDLKTSTLYAQIAAGHFPPADYHQNKMPMWRESTLARHQRALMKANGKRRARFDGEAA
jgi:hypothetical protein